ncbi:hypothetical protein B0H14DRAFT_3459828 [Mycena olivaceomarginata]|nr:hypothetical protein B0H14DRAFT_3459828 [Mycena olivaceomarginata]
MAFFPASAYHASAIPARTNFAALKHLGVRTIIAFPAVGSLREEIARATSLCFRNSSIAPGACAHLIFDGTGLVARAGFSDPCSQCLAAWLADAMQALKAERSAVKLWTKKTLGVSPTVRC